MSDSAPPTDRDGANIHDLAKASEAEVSAIDTIAGFLERIEGSVTGLSKELSNMAVREETKARLARERHDDVCKRLDAQATRIEQLGTFLHEGLRQTKDHEERIGDVERFLFKVKGEDDGGRPAPNPAE